jgi:hypothetical protein
MKNGDPRGTGFIYPVKGVLYCLDFSIELSAFSIQLSAL